MIILLSATMKTRYGLMVVAFIGCFVLSQTMPVKKTILIEPETVKYDATFIHASATIDDLTINFGTGSSNEELLRVPIAAPEELTSQTMFRITVGMIPPTSDQDPRVGITDGVNHNQFRLVDYATTTSIVNPCILWPGRQTYRSGRHEGVVAGTYTMLFDTMRNYGICSTNNGFTASGKFYTHVDPTKGLSLIVHRENSSERYSFYFFLIEFL